MRKALRFFLWSLIVVVALVGALFGYFVYAPTPEVPRLSGKLTKRTIEAGGLKRTYLTYVPSATSPPGRREDAGAELRRHLAVGEPRAGAGGEIERGEHRAATFAERGVRVGEGRAPVCRAMA